VLEEPTLCKLVTENIELVKAGVLVLDLRKTVNSFTDLVEEKYGKSGLPEMRKMAEFLDEIVPAYFILILLNLQIITKNI